ncbi:hypothetical protein GDO86_014698 [Hymenochirus boettgeri]|uniref:Uncharacterized protein n=1 Tax=Hymenochirus boettgeri TaxID=247094 RepID=A0A8T2JTV2_9PIPI|nr:hypothetical protein GDO86_014698 [Hymenochirus boettgeri]
MQRLRAPDGGAGRLPVTPRSSMSVSHEVTVEGSSSSQTPSPRSPTKAEHHPTRAPGPLGGQSEQKEP